MKSRILVLTVLVVLILTGCGGGKKGFTLDDFTAIEPGTPRTEIVKRFGEPAGELSGMYGDIYVTADSVQVIVYYDQGGKMLEVKKSQVI